jgi:cytidine deaminase
VGRGESLDAELEKLIHRAVEVLSNAYAPYSGVKVAAAVETTDGDVFLGVNVENASYGLTICAERVAVAAAITAGKRAIKRVVIVSNTDEPLPPCGACRQVLREHAVGDVEVVSYSVTTRKLARWKLEDLIPYPLEASHVTRTTYASGRGGARPR